MAEVRVNEALSRKRLASVQWAARARVALTGTSIVTTLMNIEPVLRPRETTE